MLDHVLPVPQDSGFAGVIKLAIYLSRTRSGAIVVRRRHLVAPDGAD